MITPNNVYANIADGAGYLQSPHVAPDTACHLTTLRERLVAATELGPEPAQTMREMIRGGAPLGAIWTTLGLDDKAIRRARRRVRAEVKLIRREVGGPVFG